jgi:hypothetical protein
MIKEITENSQTKLHVIPKKAYQHFTEVATALGASASMQEGNTLKAIRLTQLQECPKKL